MVKGEMIVKCGSWRYAQDSNERIHCDTVLATLPNTVIKLKLTIICPNCGETTQMIHRSNVGFAPTIEYKEGE